MKHSPQKLHAYQTLFTLNQAFENVLADLHRLQRLPFFRLEFLREFQVMAEETRAVANKFTATQREEYLAKAMRRIYKSRAISWRLPMRPRSW